MYGTGFHALFLDTAPLAHGLKVAQGSGEFREWSGFLKQTIGIQIVGRVWMAVPVLLLLKLFLIFRVKASWRLAKKVSPPLVLAFVPYTEIICPIMQVQKRKRASSRSRRRWWPSPWGPSRSSSDWSRRPVWRAASNSERSLKCKKEVNQWKLHAGVWVILNAERFLKSDILNAVLNAYLW